MSAPAKIRTLRQRGDYLSRQLRSGAAGRPREYHELAALAWALPILDDLVKRNAEQAVDVHRQSRDAAYAWLASVAVERLAECDPAVAAGVLAECADESVRRAVIRNVREHSGRPGLAEHLSELVAVRWLTPNL